MPMVALAASTALLLFNGTIRTNTRSLDAVAPALCFDSTIKATGTLEAVELMQRGYPSRIPYSAIHERYKVYMPPFVQELPPSEFVEAIALAQRPQRDRRTGRHAYETIASGQEGAHEDSTRQAELCDIDCALPQGHPGSGHYRSGDHR